MNNGEAIPRLSDALELEASIINIELIGEPGWKNVLAAVESHEALKRVIFSSAEHSEILQLWAACPHARCGFIWEADEADELTQEEINDLPKALLLHIPMCSISKRPDFWKQFAKRIVVLGVSDRGQVASLGFEPLGIIIV
jgi:glycerophosphoryl diester phosphodiesterase